MKYDIKTVDHWDAPKEDGVAILTAPNIALPCHGLCPRTIDPKRWENMRKQCYVDANFHCQATGVELGKGHCHAHEVVSIDWAKQTETFERTVCLDPRIHTRFIHSGRAITLFERGDKYMTKEALLSTLEYGFGLIATWNLEHPSQEPLRVFDTFLEWAKNPTLKTEVNQLIEKYGIKFYTFDKKWINKKHWPNWKLVYNGTEYPTKFPTQKDWKKHFEPAPVKDNPFDDKTFTELERIIKEENVSKN